VRIRVVVKLNHHHRAVWRQRLQPASHDNALEQRYPKLEFVFFEGLQGGGASAQRIVFGDAVEDMNAAIVQQGRLGNSPLGFGRAELAAL
jgi:hypothetical protein